MAITIAAFSGSLRKESYSTKLLKAAKDMAPAGVTVNIIEIGQLPHFNEDLEADLPPGVKDLHDSIKAADAVLFVTPEYNRSYAPALKNAIDWGSRPDGENAWEKKPAAVMATSYYSLGGFGAAYHLRQVMTYVDLYTMQQPEFYMSYSGDKFDESGNLTDQDTREHIEKFWNEFMAWIEQTTKKTAID